MTGDAGHGFNAVNWMGAAAAAPSVGVLAVTLLPATHDDGTPNETGSDAESTADPTND
jgi:hypothetical protein